MSALTGSDVDEASRDAQHKMADLKICRDAFALCRAVVSYGVEEKIMVSSRAREVAEVLWELKRAEKVATFSTIASRAGFSAGSNGRAIISALRTVRRDWPHLQWWRAINDNGILEKGSEQATQLRKAGYELESADGNAGAVQLAEFRAHLMDWSKSDDQQDVIPGGTE